MDPLRDLEISLEQIAGGEPDIPTRQALQENGILDADLFLECRIVPHPEAEGIALLGAAIGTGHGP